MLVCFRFWVTGYAGDSLHVSGWPKGHPKIEEGEGLVENYQGGVILTTLLRKPVRYNPFKCSVTEMETQHGMLELKLQKIEEGEGLVENYQGGVILTALLRKPVRYNPFKCSVTEMETQHGMLELKQQK